MCLFFFFSSRRRHTRWTGDWSSDVCSSDLKHARAAGAHQVVVGEDPSAAAKFGPYDLILESVGGNSLAAVMKMIAPGGMCVLYGVSASSETTFDAAAFMRTGGASLYGFILFHEIPHRPVAQGLARLV